MKTLLTIALLGAALGCVSSSKYERKEKEAVELDAVARRQSAKIAELEKQGADLETKGAELERQVAQLQKEREELQVKAASLSQEKGQLEAKSAEYEALTRSLGAQIEQGQVELSELRGKMIVKLKDRILFPSGSARLNADGRKALDEVARAFAGLEGKSIVVAGYTDAVPVGKSTGFADNWALSTARAAAVVRYLAEKGIDPRMLGAAGFSEYRPVAGNDTPEGRSLNRRIEIGLTAADDVPPVVDVAN